MKNYSQETITRFESHIIKTESCWLWDGCRPTEYGTFGPSEGTTIATHRFSYQVYKGDIPANLLVRHTCDVPSCVNPDHLLLGTNQDNAADKMARGRWKAPRKDRSAYRSYTSTQNGYLYAVASVRKPDGRYRRFRRRITTPAEAPAVAARLKKEKEGLYSET